jgi:hypothetical protein
MTVRARLLFVVLFAAICAAGTFLLVPSWPQDPAYHHFADRRTMLGIPNALNVLTNLPFLAVGVMVLAGLRRVRSALAPGERLAPTVLFAIGMLLTAIGSSIYHWNPTNATLGLDRGGMVVALMALVALLDGAFIGRQVLATLVVAELIGIGSVVWWRLTDDLRLYGVVQFFPGALMIILPLVARSRDRGTWKLAPVIVFYAVAKACETYDRAIDDALGHLISGHSLKHLAAAAASLFIWLWIEDRSHSRGRRSKLSGRATAL